MNGLILLSVVCLSATLVSTEPAKTYRFWDCCKPSCAWDKKAAVTAPVQACEKDGVTAAASSNIASVCGGGGAAGKTYLCNNNQPVAINASLSFGFVGAFIKGQTESDWCCACYELKFPKLPGKTYVVQASSTGGDRGGSYFDLYMPGGGVGGQNGCSDQWGAGQNGWGERSTGVPTVAGCDTLPKELQAGCKWHFEWLDNLGNPDVTFTRTQCPKSIVAKTKCQREDDKTVASAA